VVSDGSSVLEWEYPDVAAEDDSLHGRLCDPHDEVLKATRRSSLRLQDLNSIELAFSPVTCSHPGFRRTHVPSHPARSPVLHANIPEAA
jgi:hypothetical protein